MGYNVYVTRADDWSRNEGAEISGDEWLRLVHSDAELTIYAANGRFFALWDGKSELVDPWIDWLAGNLYTKNPDRALLRKLLEIASRLGARVQGDEGEEYLSEVKVGGIG